MATFGIIGEGHTDQIVIKNILKGYFGQALDEVRYVQPPEDETSVHGGAAHGGWTLVFAALRTRRHEDALQLNDYLILQIDTDRSEDKGFDVPHKEGGRELLPEELIERVVQRLIQEIGVDFYANYRDRFVFAVAVDEIECWLLPLVFSHKRKASKITGCLEAVDLERAKTKGLVLLKRADGKNPRGYEEASKEFRNHRNLMSLGPKNPSLHVFLEGLKALPLPAAPQS